MTNTKAIEIVRATTGVTNALLTDLKKNGQIFTAVFIKKDGTLRVMNCRCGVKKYTKGGTLGYNATEKGLMSVFDLEKMEYRMINLDTLLSIVHRGKHYIFNNVIPELTLHKMILILIKAK
jgi:hypothetical protein